MRASDFDFSLPTELIAQTPSPEREHSRLLVLRRSDGQVAHRHFKDLPDWITPGDVVVLNNSRVIPARLRGFKKSTGGEIEILLLEENRKNDWWVLLRPGKRVRAGSIIGFQNPDRTAEKLEAIVVQKNAEG